MSRTEVDFLTDAAVFSWPGAASATISPAIASPGTVYDLGNLIQVAVSAVNIISRNSEVESSPDLEPVVTSARLSLQRAGEIVEQTIRFARDDAMAQQIVNVSACLAEVAALVKTAWKSGIDFDFQAASDLPAATCNRLKRQSAVLNLLLNSRDAMPDGGGISVRAAAIHDGPVAKEVEIRVADNGIGMNSDTLARAIDPYFTTKTSGLGGLGLPMVIHFVQEAGGHFRIESEQGVGTVVILRLPVFTMKTEHEPIQPQIPTDM